MNTTDRDELCSKFDDVILLVIDNTERTYRRALQIVKEYQSDTFELLGYKMRCFVTAAARSLLREGGEFEQAKLLTQELDELHAQHSQDEQILYWQGVARYYLQRMREDSNANR